METRVSSNEVFLNIRSLEMPREHFRGAHQSSGKTPNPPGDYQKVLSIADLPRASKAGNWYIDPAQDEVTAKSEQELNTGIAAIEDRSLFAKQLLRHIAVTYAFEQQTDGKWIVPYAGTMDIQSSLRSTITKKLVDEFQEEIFQVLPEEIKQWSNNDLERFLGSVVSQIDDIEKSITFIQTLAGDELTERAANNFLSSFSFVPQEHSVDFPLKRLLESTGSSATTFTETLEFLSFSMSPQVREKALRTLGDALRGGLDDRLPAEKLLEILKRTHSAKSDSSALVRRAGVELDRQLRISLKGRPDISAGALEAPPTPSTVSSLVGESVLRVADLNNRLEIDTPLQPEEVRRLFEMYDRETKIRNGVRRQTTELLHRSDDCAVTLEESFKRLQAWKEPKPHADWKELNAAIGRKAFLISNVLRSQMATPEQREKALQDLSQSIERRGIRRRTAPFLQVAQEYAAGSDCVRKSLLKALPDQPQEIRYLALRAICSCDPERASEIAAHVVELLSSRSHSPGFTLSDTNLLIAQVGKSTIPELNKLAGSGEGYLQNRAFAAAAALVEAGKAGWNDFPKLKALGS